MKFIGRDYADPINPPNICLYTYGPIERDIDDYGSSFDTYIFMDFVEGQDLDRLGGGAELIRIRRSVLLGS